MMRFNVTVPEGTMRLYYNSIDECKSCFPEAEISECNDNSHTFYINKIKDSSSETLYDYRGREIWVIHTEIADILYRQFFCDEEPIDGCEFQFRGYQINTPCLFTLSTPEYFYNNYLKLMLRGKCEYISPSEGKQRELKKAFDKDGLRYFIDKHQNWYVINKNHLPTPKHTESYRKYHDTDAVFVRYGVIPNTECKWFNDFNEFYNEFQIYCKDFPASHGTPNYTIIMSAKQLKNLNDFKSVLSVGKIPPDVGSADTTSRIWAYQMKSVSKNWDEFIPILKNIINFERKAA